MDKLEILIGDHFQGEFLKQYMAKEAYTFKAVYLEHPLIFKMGIESQFDSIITCDAPEEIRIQRIIERDGCSERVARLMMKRQEENTLTKK